jgi:phosphohistidine swiveling domain-containing protein
MKYHFIHERSQCSILAVQDVAEVWSSTIARVVGKPETPLYFFYTKDRVHIISGESRYQQIALAVWKRVQRDRTFALRISREFNRRAVVLSRLSRRMYSLPLRHASNDELVTLRKQVHAAYLSTAPYGEPLPYFIKEHLDSALNEIRMDTGMSAGEYQAVLAPVYESFVERESRELHALASLQPGAMREIALDRHAEKYALMHFDYEGPVRDTSYFRTRLSSMRRRKELQRKDAIQQKQKEIFTKYRLKNTQRYLFSLLQIGYTLMDVKKEIQTQAHYALSLVYAEIARRIGITHKQINLFLWEEIEAVLLGRRAITRTRIRSRSTFCGFVFINGRGTQIVQRDARRIYAAYLRERLKSVSKTELHGMPAYYGKLVGSVWNVSKLPARLPKKHGNILVVSKTTPDFIPAIKSVRAIVTDEGGVTSHAAIVSRELGIPCIVGTKIATKVFKNGDRVEVDANRGIVRKI